MQVALRTNISIRYCIKTLELLRYITFDNQIIWLNLDTVKLKYLKKSNVRKLC